MGKFYTKVIFFNHDILIYRFFLHFSLKAIEINLNLDNLILSNIKSGINIALIIDDFA
jgi:hypothetical protein